MKELEILHSIGRLITSLLDLDELLTRIVEASVDITGAEEGYLLLVDGGTGELYLRAGQNLGEEYAQGFRLKVHDSIAGSVVKTGKPAIAESKEERSLKIKTDYHVQALLNVPLKVREKVIGVLGVDNKVSDKAFSEHNLHMLSILADYAAIAIENAQLFDDAKQRARKLETLQNLALTVSASLDLDETLRKACQAAVEFFNADHSGLVLFDPSYVEGMVKAEYPALGTLGTILPLRGVPAEERLIETQEQLVIHDVVGDNSLQEVRDILLGFDIQSILIVPVMGKDGGVLGSFSVDAVGHCRQFAAEEVELCRVFAAHVAAAVENAHLFEDAHEGRAYVQSLYEASSAIISPQDPGQVLQTIVATARKVTGAWRAAVFLVDEGEQPKVLAQAGFDRKLEAATAIRSGGISKEVIRSKRPRFFSDALAVREKLHPSMIEQGARAAACLPLLLFGKAIGVLWIQFRQPHFFSLTEKQALQLYANQSAVAYDTARRMREREHLRCAAEKLASVATVQDVLQQIVKSAKEVLVADSVVVWSYDDVQHTFLPDQLVADGIEPELVERFRGDQPHPGGTAEIVMKRDCLAVPDIDDPEYTFLGPAGRGLRGAIGVKAFQGIALRVGQEKLGVLYVNYEQPRNFSAEDRAILETFAYHAALTLKKARLLDQVRKARDAAKVVAEVSVLEDLERTLDSIVKGTQDVLGCDTVSLYPHDQTQDRIGYPPTMIGVWYPERTTRLPEVERDSIVFKVLNSDEAYIVDNTSTDSLFGNIRFVLDEKIKSWIGMPLKVRDRRVGVIFVSYRSRHRFTGEELANIELFAHQAAVAIRNAQLYEETARRANALQALYEASQAVIGTLTLDELLNHVVEQAWRLAEPRGEKTHFSHLALLDGSRIRFTAAYPPEMLAKLRDRVCEIDLEGDAHIGITGRAVTTRQSQLVGNVFQDPDYIETDSQVCSQLSVSIKMGEQVIGVISVEHPDYSAFSEEDRWSLESLAAQAAIAIENARLYEGEQRRVREAEAMVQVGQAISSTLDLGRILETVAKNALSLLGLEDGKSTIFLVDEKTGDFVRATRVPPRKDGNGPRPSGGLTSLVIETGEPIVIPDVRRDSRVRASVVKKGVRSLIGVPSKVKERTIGVLFASTFCPRDFTQRDIEMLSSLANQAAIAIENARLYEKQQHEAEQLAAINQIAAEISSTLDLDKILQTLVDELARVIGVEQCAIAIFDERGEYGDVVAEYLEEDCMPSKGIRIPLRDNASVELVRKTKRPLAVKDAQQDPIMEKVWDIMKQRRTQSIMIVPIVIGDRVIGTIGLDAVSGPREFTEEEKWLAETIAYHAAIAIQNARQFRLRDGLLKAGEVVTAEGELYPALEVIARSVKETIGCDVVSLHTYDQEEREISYPSVVVGELHKPQEQAVWQLVSREKRLQIELLGEHSAIRKLLKHGFSRFAFCSAEDPILGAGNFVVREGIESSAGILLKIGEEVVGILFVNYRSAHHFSDEEKQAAGLFAVQAALTIQSARRYEELKKIKGFVGARTAIDWMRMVSTAWGHSIRREVSTALGHMALLRGLLARGESAQEVEKELDQFENVIKGIKEIPIIAPLSYEDAVDSVQINELVKTYLERQWKHDRYRPVKLYYELHEDLDSTATVRASRQWLRRALEILVDNSVQAMLEADTSEKRLTVTTQLVGKTVEISVKDTGPGISKDVLAKLFEKPIDKSVGSRGAGIGLMLAQTIVQTYRGDIRVEPPGERGTNMVIVLPVEN